MKLLKAILFLFINLTCLASYAQEKTSYQMGLSSGYGFIISHNPGMLYITGQHIEKHNAYFEQNTFGSKAWQQRYGFPQIGLSLSYFKLNNPEHLGNGVSLSPYLKFKLNQSEIIKLKLRTSLGIGYLSNKFHPQDNYKNNAIGSDLNLFFSVWLGTEIPLTSTLNFSLAASFSHFSNTAYSKPNLGMNIPAIEGGFSYNFGEKHSMIINNEEPFERTKGYWQLTSSFGVNATYPPNDVKYLASTLSLGREKKLNYKSTLGASIDFFYNPAQRQALKRRDITVDKGWENLQSGLSIYHLLHFGRFGVITQAGYYLKTKDDELGNFYHIVGGRIHLNNKFSGYFALKTHFAKAEYFTLGVNYKLKNE